MATAAAKTHRRSKLHEEHEEHVNHERWLITYADMITLLMVLFIVLYSTSQVDLAKFRRLKQGIAGDDFGKKIAIAIRYATPVMRAATAISTLSRPSASA